MNITSLISFFPKTQISNRPAVQFGQTLSPQAADVIHFGAKSLKQRVEKHVPVVIVGGGIAGLMAQYELSKKGVPSILLESEKRLGGNTNSDVSHRGVPYTTGATIFLPGGERPMRMWKELGMPLKEEYLLKPEIYTLPNGERFTAFGTRADRAEFQPKSPEMIEGAKGVRKLLRDLRRISQSKTLQAIMPIQDASRRAMNKWDGMSFAKFLKPYGDAVRKLIEPYILSDIAAPSEKVSAYVGMLDIEDLINERYVLPGGNNMLTQRLAEKIKAQSSTLNEKRPIRLGNQVERIEQDQNRAYIKYRDAHGKLRVISADSVLLATPYHTVPKMLDVPAKVAKLMQSIPKNSYTVVNVFLKKTPLKTHQFYMLPESKHIADLFVAIREARPDHRANPDEPSVMTLYTPNTGRIRNTEKFKKEILADIYRHFPEITPDMVEGVRLNPFKHAMAAVKPGQVAQLADMQRTFGRVTLINTDGGAVPSMLEAFEEAMMGVDTATRQVQAQKSRKA